MVWWSRLELVRLDDLTGQKTTWRSGLERYFTAWNYVFLSGSVPAKSELCGVLGAFCSAEDLGPNISKQELQSMPVERETRGKYWLVRIQTPSISAPLDCLARSHFTRASPEASFSQAHSSLSHRMSYCSLVALLALILSDVLFLPMKKGNSLWQDKPG